MNFPRLLSVMIVGLSFAAGVFAAEPAAPKATLESQALGLPKAGPTNEAPYVPQPILQGGIVVPLYPSGSPFLRSERVSEAEHYTLSRSVPGRFLHITNIHNPSIEFHPADPGANTGATLILAAGGGHNTLNVGSESADLVPYFFQFGINTVILRNRLRRDGYQVQGDAVRDAFQAIRMVRSRAKEWNLDPNKIGIMGFSAGAELSAPAAVFFPDFDRTNQAPADPLTGVSARPDFVSLIYPGPSPFARGGNPPIPTNTPPAFVASPGSGDRVHAMWAMEYYTAMLQAGVPNIELHVYGTGRHPGELLGDGSRMAAGLSDRNGMPFGKWQDRFVDWFRDLGFLQKPGVETRAARDLAARTQSNARLPEPTGITPGNRK